MDAEGVVSAPAPPPSLPSPPPPDVTAVTTQLRDGLELDETRDRAAAESLPEGNGAPPNGKTMAQEEKSWPPESGSAPPDADEGPVVVTYRWELVRPGSLNGLKRPPLVFDEDAHFKEASSKRWRPQGPLKKLLEANHFTLLKKAPVRHKNSKYWCKICDLHWDTLLQVEKHAADKRHTASRRRHEEMTAVSTLPGPTPAQTSCLTGLLSRLYEERGLTPHRLAERRRVADQLRQTVLDGLRQHFDGAEYALETFGSARHGCGFADSCLDMALLTPDDSVGAPQLTHAIHVLEQSQLFTEVSHDFHSWVPCVRCVHAASGQPCLVGLGAGKDVQLAQLVQLYTTLDERCAPLAVALRHLAQVCEMDRPKAGSLPPSAFMLMTIYYLQQCQPPVLPVLHELAGVDPSDPQAKLDIDLAAGTAAGWRSENTDDLGLLWLRLLRFYALELTGSKVVVSIRQREPVTCEDKGWGNKKISIEDPIQSKRNISRSISSSAVADVIVDRLRAACLLFGVPRTAEGAASMPLVCSVCQKAGHVMDDCPTLVVPAPEPLPPASEQQIATLDRLCRSAFDDWALPSEEYVGRQKMLEGVESYIRHYCFPSARLTLFGSSCNGFGFRNSDLDICMTFEDCTDPQALDQAEIIKKLANALSRLRSLCNIIPITTAKVPIVKFTDRRTRLEGDISLYNTLAQHNTMLLHTYARIDSRGRMLGYMVKLMAKICDVCDASRGSLSSYAYTLMMIYYLQRCQPPVLPVLQELGRHWPDAGANRSSVGELWLGFLRFYGEQFDFERHVVCVRLAHTLTKFEKLWNGAFIAIEDPFLLSHNLGVGVRRKMAAFIRRTLLKWRRHHLGYVPGTLPPGFRDCRAFLMSSEHLCEGPPPNASGCHVCGHIGHWASDCPRRRGRAAPAAKETAHCQGGL
ncbi:terminal uridylyltransferase 7-like [Pollicipes pollicipes]|uniref:terminal uridylyltransferase 7-like n=1 Tax=Pollicipes pollicipes TaxID=41117 RepID=UPI0018856B5A|nr:terminal uridylyltransferase 7-like [Pollicipes pollicipes]